MNKNKEQELLLDLRRKIVAMDEIFNTISQFSWRINQSRYGKLPTDPIYLTPELNASSIASLWEKQHILKDINNYIEENIEEINRLQKLLSNTLTTAEEEIVMKKLEEEEDEN
jgi:hypothetical protein